MYINIEDYKGLNLSEKVISDMLSAYSLSAGYLRISCNQLLTLYEWEQIVDGGFDYVTDYTETINKWMEDRGMCYRAKAAVRWGIELAQKIALLGDLQKYV